MLIKNDLLYLFYIFFVINFDCIHSKKKKIDKGLEHMWPNHVRRKHCLFQNKTTILNYFKIVKKTEPYKINSVLGNFENCLRTEKIAVPHTDRKPFIVIESYHKKIREAVAQQVAFAYKAVHFRNPPKCMGYPLFHFRDYISLKAYYALTTYASSFRASQILASGMPIVMTSYWFGQTALTLENIFHVAGRLPERDSINFRPPHDLLMPDVVVYISVDGEIMRKNKRKVFEFIYEYFDFEPTIIVTHTMTKEFSLSKTKRKVLKKLNKVLSEKFPNITIDLGDERFYRNWRAPYQYQPNPIRPNSNYRNTRTQHVNT
uniref:Uncharacterized protein n=1 Tax=Clastoptera arizonana TaxID=38151 RepID=A0A1B6D5U7_9HEMI